MPNINEYPEKSKYFPYENFRPYVKGKVLEIGCAEGNNTIFLRDFYGRSIKDMTCLEFDLKKLEKARKKLGDKVRFVNADARRLPFRDNSFDFVYCSEVIEHIPSKKDHDGVIDEIKRVLKPKGHCIITTPNKWLYHIFLILTFKKNDPTHKSELNYGEFKKLISKRFKKAEFIGIFGVFGGLMKLWPVRKLHEALMKHPGMCKAMIVICTKD